MMDEKKLVKLEKPEVEVIRFDEKSDVITDSFTATADPGTEFELPDP